MSSANPRSKREWSGVDGISLEIKKTYISRVVIIYFYILDILSLKYNYVSYKTWAGVIQMSEQLHGKGKAAPWDEGWGHGGGAH